MSTNIPASRTNSISWVSDHLALWTANALAIGLSDADVASLTTLANSAATAENDAAIAKADSKSATLDFHTKTDDMRAAAADLVATVKSFAERTNDPNVYVLANVSPADPKGVTAPPSQATNTSASLGGNGSVTVNFDGTGASGTVWQIWRKLNSESDYIFVGNAEARTKSYIDNSIPTGTTSAQYTVQGVRGSVSGPVSFALTVQFGGVSGAEDLSEAA